MSRYPINLAVDGRNVIVVGGGAVAARKCRMLIRAGAAIRVVSPRVGDAVSEMIALKKIAWTEACFSPSSLDGALLVFAATNDAEANLEVMKAASEKGILANLADDASHSDFHVPAVIRRGDLVLTVSTGGSCPGFSQYVKRRLEEDLTEGMGFALEIASRVRRQLMEEEGGWASKSSYQALLTDSFIAACEEKNVERIDELLQHAVGKRFSLDTLVMDLSTESEEHRS